MTETELNLYKVVLEQLPEGIILLDEHDIIIFVNKKAETIRHICAADIVNRNVLLCHHEASREHVTRALQFLKSEKQIFTRMVNDKANIMHYKNIYVPLTNAEQKYIGAVLITLDETEKRKFEEEKAAYMQELESKVTELGEKLQNMYMSTMSSMVNIIEAKDPYTQGHSLRVSEIATKIAEFKYGVSSFSKTIEIAGKLHDIGKIGIQESILNKVGGLEAAEYALIKMHPSIGEKILMPIEQFKSVSIIIKYHHERYDGNGYPDGLCGEDIPLGSRILAIADAFDAMVSDRSYHQQMSGNKAAEEIAANSGKQFDPNFSKIFLELYYSGSIG